MTQQSGATVVPCMFGAVVGIAQTLDAPSRVVTGGLFKQRTYTQERIVLVSVPGTAGIPAVAQLGTCAGEDDAHAPVHTVGMQQSARQRVAVTLIGGAGPQSRETRVPLLT